MNEKKLQKQLLSGNDYDAHKIEAYILLAESADREALKVVCCIDGQQKLPKSLISSFRSIETKSHRNLLKNEVVDSCRIAIHVM